MYFKERTFKIQGNFFAENRAMPGIGLSGRFSFNGENGCDGANESFISRSTLPYCLYRTSAIVLSGVGLGNFGFKAKHLCCFI